MGVESEPGVPNLRTGDYNVTDKADGLRCLLFVADNGRIFLVDGGGRVYATGKQVDPSVAAGVVLDGEWIRRDRKGAVVSHYYAFDPFYALWKNGGETGVYRLRAIEAGIGRSAYAREFLTQMHIHDEIAVFLPPIGDASPTLILDRAKGNFLAAEVARIRRLFPLLAALHRRHLVAIATTGIDFGNSPIGPERPLRFVDQHGRQIFATAAWAEHAMDAEIAHAIQIVTARGPCTVHLKGQLALRRTQLPPDFGPAPSGYCDEISPDRQAGAAAPTTDDLPARIAGPLSERERTVVLLTLQGHPVIEIARRMGLSRGTVKNYRLAIYRKLDITTERELFLEFMAAQRGE
jgi:DNA-binding CsgD family transcriptional regulator